LDRSETYRALGFALEQFYRMKGTLPTAFRAGGFLSSPYVLQALADFGIAASSNYRADQRTGNAFDLPASSPQRPFTWDNGIVELPITLSPEPLSALSARECWRRILHHVQVNRTWVVNVVIHSWSFMARDQNGHHSIFDPVLLDNFAEFLSLLPTGARFSSVEEVVSIAKARRDLLPTVEIASLLDRRSITRR
jgi:hypothetical protein